MNILETERLLIRHLNENDADFILKLLNEPSFIQNIGDRNIRTVEDARAYINSGYIASYTKNGFGVSLVILKETGEPIGVCGLIKREQLKDVDIGYAYLPNYWSKGYATEAALEMKSYAKSVFKLNRLVAIVDPANTGSIHVLEKLGMKFEKMIKLSEGDHEIKLFSCEL